MSWSGASIKDLLKLLKGDQIINSFETKMKKKSQQ